MHFTTTAVSPGPRGFLTPLQGLRFFAAMHVVLLHTSGAAWLPPRVSRLADWGASTANLFFILSGFILTYAYAAPGGLRVSTRDFYRRRFVRLFPLALLGHALTAPLVWNSYGPVERWARAAASAASLQAWWPPFAGSFNSPSWSLSYLALGYLLLPWVLRSTTSWAPRRLAWALAALWAAMLVPAALYVALQPSDVFWRMALFTFPLLRLPEFLFGVILALLLTHQGGRRAPGWLAPAALAGLVAGLVLTPAPLFALNHNGLYAPLHAALIWGLATSGGPVQRLLSAAWAQRLGDASFGIYLLHVPIHSWMLRLLGGKVSEWGPAPSAAFYLAYLALAVAAGWIAHHWFVEPIAARVRRSPRLPPEEATARQAA